MSLLAQAILSLIIYKSEAIGRATFHEVPHYENWQRGANHSVSQNLVYLVWNALLVLEHWTNWRGPQTKLTFTYEALTSELGHSQTYDTHSVIKHNLINFMDL